MLVIDKGPDHWWTLFKDIPDVFNVFGRGLGSISCPCRSFLGELRAALANLMRQWSTQVPDRITNPEPISLALHMTRRCLKTVAERRRLPTTIAEYDIPAAGLGEWLKDFKATFDFR